MLGHVFLGRFKTIRLLGEGGMGRVYLAHDTNLDREVVIKVMHDHIAADPTFRERFQRETFLTAKFQHPYAVTVYDAYPNEPSGPFILMEYIRGESLDVVLGRNRRLDPARVGRLLNMLCEVLQAAHGQGIVHRDLKPANLMIVGADTPYEMLKVMDFGLAKLLGPTAKATVTNTEFAVGTPGYMCPEQARGEDMDHRGDLYAVGVILYELLVGQLPFAGRSTMDVLLAHATEEPPSFNAVGVIGVVAPAIENVVQRCLAKDPNDRPTNARELAELFNEALAASQGQPPVLQVTTPGSPPPRSPKLRPARALAPHLEPVLDVPDVPFKAPVAPVAAVVAPDPVVVKSPTPIPTTLDPLAIVHHFEAWMQESVAKYKLRGFIHDKGAELVESIPGRICMRIGTKECAYSLPSRGLSWLGLTRRTIDVELRLQRPESNRDNQIRITAIFSSAGNDLNADLAWRAVCSQVYCDLRAYLMGNNNAACDGA